MRYARTSQAGAILSAQLPPGPWRENAVRQIRSKSPVGLLHVLARTPPLQQDVLYCNCRAGAPRPRKSHASTWSSQSSSSPQDLRLPRSCCPGLSSRTSDRASEVYCTSLDRGSDQQRNFHASNVREL
nr:hypothetical protein CFP56_23815 [Quercus suber]